MQTSEIGADFARLSHTREHIATTGAQVNGQLGDLKSYLKPLVASWEGAASANYQALQHKWDTAAADLNSVLLRIGAALQAANEGMQSTEQSNANRF